MSDNSQGKKVLVTGASGFLDSHVVALRAQSSSGATATIRTFLYFEHLASSHLASGHLALVEKHLECNAVNFECGIKDD
jgi:hypothetical protein